MASFGQRLVLLPKGAPFDDEELREHRDVNGGWLRPWSAATSPDEPVGTLPRWSGNAGICAPLASGGPGRAAG